MIDSKALFLLLTLALLGLGSARVWDRYFSSSAEILFWDVGQGDSILLKLPWGKSYLLDTGGGWRNSRMGEELAGELADKSLLRLDGLFLSHFDSDHAGGSLGLFRKIQVDEIFYSASLHSLFPLLLKRIQAEGLSRKIPLRALSQSHSISGKGFQMKVSPIDIQSKKSNNLGLWIELNVYGCRFLFTGDMEKEAEGVVSQQITPPFHVLKVAHHGSLTSSKRSFLSRVLPAFSVISVGAQNSYGHPKAQVLERLRYFRSQILRTDFHGFISFKVNPTGKLSCTHALGSCGEIQCGI